ncbi:hypothetical protein HPB48_001536 [Haemaphysalis longicornis]|uniref:Hydantoinase B/oxoprolinase domain-containing protein n=1 Tax=Haemaphysalis longicornis TaxID=44386 RepID=A0A9J6FDY3_HAELO|nr:hypothetical protein HPB48_001536 [Haemaphysalis longicornis]
MQEAVQYQVFYKGEPRPVFFVANRGHHADIGGKAPGSMPADSHSILEEGATFVSFKIVQAGVFQQEALTDALNAPAALPNCSGTRNLRDNLADLQAQIAANQKGITLVKELIDQYGLEAVQAYMGYVQDNAEVAIRDLLRSVARTAVSKLGKAELYACDRMDDGSRICLTVSLNEKEGSAVFDFSGTGREVHGNLNAPRAVTLSAILYCLRCMVGHDLPLNQGCLAPVQVVLPDNSLLNPSPDAAVVGGNVLTSQRVVDVIFHAFNTCAASQASCSSHLGCMNNITFGDETLGYYETIGGGAGAVSLTFLLVLMVAKTSCVYNKVIEYLFFEVFFYAYTCKMIAAKAVKIQEGTQVILQRYHLNPHTGGQGQFVGGDGVVRELLFRKPLHLSVLTERRVFAPYGLQADSPQSEFLLCPYSLLLFPVPVRPIYSEILSYYKATRNKFPTPHTKFQRQEQTALRSIQTNAFPHLSRLHKLYPTQYPKLCPKCNEVATLYHMAAGCHKIHKHPLTEEQCREALSSTGYDAQCRTIARAATATLETGALD